MSPDTPDPGQQASPGSSRRRRWLIGAASALAVGAIVALLAVGLFGRGVDRSIDQALVKGEPKPAPAFTLPLLVNGGAVGRRDGERLAVADLRGRPVVLNFWASWCDPCKREAPILEAAWQRGRASGLVVLGVDVQDLSESARGFVAGYGQTYPHVRDGGDRTYRAYGLTGVPETFFIDPQGRVRAHWIGEINADQLADGVRVIQRSGT